MHDQRVIFVEQSSVRRQTLLEAHANLLIGVSLVRKAMSLQHSPRVSIHHKHWAGPRVQQNRIRCLWPDAVHREQFRTQGLGRNTKHPVQRSLVICPQKANEGLQLPGLLPVVARRADQVRQFGLRNCFHGWGGKQFFLAQSNDSAPYIRPTGILRKDGPHDDLKTASCGPPVLDAVSAKKYREVIAQNGKGMAINSNRFVPQVLARGRGLSAKRVCRNRRCRHLLRTIATPAGQVKKRTPYLDAGDCSVVQVLANSQRVANFGHRSTQAFAMVGVGCKIFRECSGCLSVWAKYC
jgi:hypothetical protein